MIGRLINIEWISQAKASWHATQTQLEFVQEHIKRVEERRNRYELTSYHYKLIDLEVFNLAVFAAILAANLEGKTVQMS